MSYLGVAYQALRPGHFFIQRIKKNGKEMPGILYFKPDAQMVKSRKKSRKRNLNL